MHSLRNPLSAVKPSSVASSSYCDHCDAPHPAGELWFAIHGRRLCYDCFMRADLEQLAEEEDVVVLAEDMLAGQIMLPNSRALPAA